MVFNFQSFSVGRTSLGVLVRFVYDATNIFVDFDCSSLILMKNIPIMGC